MSKTPSCSRVCFYVNIIHFFLYFAGSMPTQQSPKTTTPQKTPRKVGRPPKNTPKKNNKNASLNSPYAHPPPGALRAAAHNHQHAAMMMMTSSSNTTPMGHPLLPPPSPISDFRNRYTVSKIYFENLFLYRNVKPSSSIS